MTNCLHYGDNLSVLRNSIRDESVDLIYLDPPFNSNASYNILFQSPDGTDSGAQIEAFNDIWTWSNASETAFDETLNAGNTKLAEVVRSLRLVLGENNMMAYLSMMAVRLTELHRVLKPTGSIYLHCDPIACHYLRILMDSTFGSSNFRNEITWRRATSHNDAKRFGRISDRIIFYSKSDDYFWNGDAIRTPHSDTYLAEHYRHSDSRGRFKKDNLTGPSHGTASGESAMPWRGYDVVSRGRVWSAPKVGKGTYASFINERIIEGYSEIEGVHDRLDALDKAGLIYHPKKGFWPSLKKYIDADLGETAQDIILQPTGFTNYSTRNGEFLGYPTQKPVSLVEVFIKASSPDNGLVLDPFCGCGTTIHAAEKLGRRWTGIDITHLAVQLIRRRLLEAFPQADFEIQGVPKDLDGAKALAEQDKHEFEKWAISLLPDAQHWKDGKKGADQGVDGVIFFGKPTKKAIISVKGGKNIGPSMVRDLVGSLDIHKADVGFFVTLTPPTKQMISVAASAGQFHFDKNLGQPIPRVQIVTIEDCLRDWKRPIQLPVRQQSGRRAAPEITERQKSFDL